MKATDKFWWWEGLSISSMLMSTGFKILPGDNYLYGYIAGFFLGLGVVFSIIAFTKLKRNV